MKKNLLLIFLWAICFVAPAQISITFTNVVQPCNNNGAVTAIVSGGTAPYSYKWEQSNSVHSYLLLTTISTGTSFSNMPKGNYFFTVTDANNITARDSIYMPGVVHFLGDSLGFSTCCPSYAYQINVNANCPAYVGNTGLHIQGSNAPYIFILSSVGTQTTSATNCTFNNLPIGFYTCTVLDNSGCSDTTSIHVSASPGYYVNVTNTPDTCTSNGTSTAIPVGGLAPYTYLWNTSPLQPTQTATGLPSYYNSNLSIHVTVTDSNGCVATGYSFVQDSITPHSIQSVATIQNATCGQSDGYIVVSNSGGMPPYNYQWSTGSTLDSVYNLSPGMYTVTVTDAAGCHEKYVKQVWSNSPVSANLSVTNTNCSNTGGAIITSVSGGTPPYTYAWSTGQNTTNLSNLGAGLYSLVVMDANGCGFWAWDSVYNPNSCVAKISGRVFNDMNGNCVFDSNESGLPQQIVQLNNGTMYYTDWSGMYYIPPVLNPTGTYTLAQTPMTPWMQVCPTGPITLALTGGNTYLNNNFYDQPVPLQNDLEVFVSSDSCRPGFMFTQWVSVLNRGTSTMTGSMTLQHDALLNVVSSGSATFYNSSAHTFTFNFNNLAPMTWYTGYVILQASSSTALFTPLTSYAAANPVGGDVTPNNNYDTLHYRVTGSYDPNSKSVSPAGAGPAGNISTADSELSYAIHFQNTGSYPTTFVSILDTISPNLDIHTLKITGSYIGGNNNIMPAVSFPSSNVVKFDFNYCNLQPAAWDMAKSEGFISYTIKQKPNLPIGAQIKNRADIYFDYNTAILTNTTLNTINAVGIDEISKKDDVKIYPNPASNVLTIECTVQGAELKMMDVLGNEIKKEKFNNKTQIDVSDLKQGVYFLNITGLKGFIIKKIIVQH
jgi:hypothetical protein